MTNYMKFSKKCNEFIAMTGLSVDEFDSLLFYYQFSGLKPPPSAGSCFIVLGMEYRNGSYAKYKIEYHFVRVTTAGELTRAMIDEYLAHHF